MYTKKNVFQGAANELTGAVGVGIHKSLCSNIIEGVSAEVGKSLSWCHLLNRCEYYSVMIWLSEVPHCQYYQLSFLVIPTEKHYMKCKSGLTSVS